MTRLLPFIFLIYYILFSNLPSYSQASCSLSCNNGGTPSCRGLGSNWSPTCTDLGPLCCTQFSGGGRACTGGIECPAPVPITYACNPGYTTCPPNIAPTDPGGLCCLYGCCPSNPTQCKCSNNNQCSPNCSVQTPVPPTIYTCDPGLTVCPNSNNTSALCCPDGCCSSNPGQCKCSANSNQCSPNCPATYSCNSGYTTCPPNIAPTDPGGICCLYGCCPSNSTQCKCPTSNQCSPNCTLPTPTPTTPSGTISSTSSSTGGLSSDTFDITLMSSTLNSTTALNVYVSFSPQSVALLDKDITFYGNGIEQLLTDVDTIKNILTVVWMGALTDDTAHIAGMLKPGTLSGSTSISVNKIEAVGGIDITNKVTTTISPTSITNSTTGSTPPVQPPPSQGFQEGCTYVCKDDKVIFTNSNCPPDQGCNPASIQCPGSTTIVKDCILPNSVTLSLLPQHKRGSFKLLAEGNNFNSQSSCSVSASIGAFKMNVIPKVFNWNSEKHKTIIQVVIPKSLRRFLYKETSNKVINVDVSCSNGAKGSKEITIE